MENEAIWHSFDKVVEITFGKYHKSKVVERLIWYYLQVPNTYDLIERPEEESRNIKITVNYEIWNQFLDFNKSKYG